jgi:hypothetical protein
MFPMHQVLGLVYRKTGEKLKARIDHVEGIIYSDHRRIRIESREDGVLKSDGLCHFGLLEKKEDRNALP